MFLEGQVSIALLGAEEKGYALSNRSCPTICLRQINFTQPFENRKEIYPTFWNCFTEKSWTKYLSIMIKLNLEWKRLYH